MFITFSHLSRVKIKIIIPCSAHLEIIRMRHTIMLFDYTNPISTHYLRVISLLIESFTELVYGAIVEIKCLEINGVRDLSLE